MDGAGCEAAHSALREPSPAAERMESPVVLDDVDAHAEIGPPAPDADATADGEYIIGSSGAPRRARQNFTPTQLAMLEVVFSATPLPRKQIRMQLAEQLGLPPRSVQVWFQNRRQKFKSTYRATLLSAYAQHQQNQQGVKGLEQGPAAAPAAAARATLAGGGSAAADGAQPVVRIPEPPVARATPVTTPLPSLPPGVRAVLATPCNLPPAGAEASAPAGEARELPALGALGAHVHAPAVLSDAVRTADGAVQRHEDAQLREAHGASGCRASHAACEGLLLLSCAQDAQLLAERSAPHPPHAC